MVEVIRSLSLAYVPIRKVGTTSLRRAFHGLAAGPRDLRRTADRPMSAYVRLRARGCWRFAVVRDPAERFLSAYGNRIHHHQDLTAMATHRAIARALGLNPRPEIDEFCERFWRYYWANDILRRHFRPQAAYLGRDLAWFDRIYTMAELPELAEELSARAGRDVSFERLQTGGPKLRLEDLPGRTRARVLALTEPDYAALSGYFDRPGAG